MNKSTLTVGFISLLASVNIQAADVQQGHELVETNCVRCHGSEIYTRSDRRVTSLPGLHKQVRFCEQMLGLTWFDEEVDNTATYLNQEYYKFE
ncbi:MAG: cytochrome c [Candidatus Thiodiazotropha sp. (ex Notomyrtea botanica)]|nr:cytochrome c [Candidatus Thiodiazotropha sp. (ex Notomyrtea botanica)]